MTVNTQIKNWYLKGTYVPQLGTKQFAAFAAHGFSLIRSINGKNELKYRVDPHAEAASFSNYNSTITLPGWYFIPEGIAPYSDGKETSLDALCLINGSTIHEALHARYSKKSMDDMIRDVREKMECKGVSAQLIGHITNTVEDIFIESTHLIKRQIVWLTAKNQMLFNDARFEEECSKYTETEILSVANMLMFFKRTSLRTELVSILPSEVFEALMRLVTRRTMSPASRVEVAAEILDFLIKNAEETSKAKEDSSESEESEDGESVAMEEPSKGTEEKEETGETEEEEIPDTTGTPETEETPEPTEPTKTPEEKEEKAAEEREADKKDLESKDPATELGEMPERKIREEIKAVLEGKKEELEALAKEFEKIAHDEIDELCKDSLIDENVIKFDELKNKMVVKEVAEVSNGTKNLMPIKLTNRFATLLKQMRTVLPTHGRGKETGGKLDVLRLHNIAVDGRVFSTKTVDGRGMNDKIELVILVDASGSMGGHYETADSDSYNLFEQAVSTTHKIFKALLNSNVETKVFAHTSIGHENFPMLVKIADSQTRNFDKKFESVTTMYLKENLDGIVIDEIVHKHFTSDSRTQKVMIVLSDGSPQSPNYSGDLADTHTTDMVNKAREMGVKVYSISLVSGVMSANNQIYGKEFNTDASKDLDKAMTQLVTKLVARK